MKRTAVAVLLVAALTAAPADAQEVRAPQPTVLRVSSDGNHVVDDLILASAITTSPSSWMYRVPLLRSLGLGTRRAFDELEFRRDVVRLLLFYRQKGFYEARVDTAVSRDETTVSVRFRIEEGPAVRVVRAASARNRPRSTRARRFSKTSRTLTLKTSPGLRWTLSGRFRRMSMIAPISIRPASRCWRSLTADQRPGGSIR